ncbi:MAG TPA: hypothetical protein VK388_11925 [Pyrinomonadaceae bacterium]|nr:hypothetical protein [Pyrinomonadaceae bacterium]
MKSSLSLTLAVLMLHAFSFAPLAHETPKEKAKRAMLAAEVKAGVASIGTGKSARVRVRLSDKTEYHGYITETADDHFVVADAKTGATARIAYDEVKGIKGNNLSTGMKVGVGVAVAAALAVVIGVVRMRGRDNERPDSPCQLSGVTTPCPPGCVCTQ